MNPLLPEVAGIYLRLGDAIDPAINATVHAVAQALLDDPPEGISDVIPSYASVFVEYDRRRTSEARLRRMMAGLVLDPRPVDSREVVVPVRYDGPDLQSVAEHAGIDVDEVVHRHTNGSYRVYALGFTPGFPFMGEIDPALRMPRLPQPRPRVEAHAVGIADQQTGIYPLASPGGWRLLGTALKATYDPHRERPFLLEPGDRVRFESAEGEPPPPVPPLDLLPVEPRHPVLQVIEPGLFDLVVDEGRSMAGRFGLARSGPLDRASARLANGLLGNRPDAPLIELNGLGATFALLRDTVVSFAGSGVAPLLDGRPMEPYTAVALPRGSRLSFPPAPSGARGYLAVPGGIESERFMGSASVDVRGLIGRPLVSGDLLGMAELRAARPGRSFRPYSRPAPIVRLRIVPGPQASPEALEVLARGRFTVASADRMGIRFEGETVPGGGVLSEANPLGAIQVTVGGQPLLLLNDRGTIGGYAKPAVLHSADLPKAGQLRAGDTVRFCATPRTGQPGWNLPLR